MNNKEQIINLRVGDGRSWREEEEGGNDKYSTRVSNSQELKFKLKK